MPEWLRIPHAERPGEYHYDPPAPVPIFQHQFEFQHLLSLYAARKPMRVLEVGTYYGGTLYHLLRLAPRGATVVSADIYNTGPDTDNRALYPDWTPDGVTLHVIVGDSRKSSTVRQVAAHAPFDFIWIDADHYEASVQLDWDNYGAMAAPGAIVAFHDIITHESWPSIEVEKVWRRIQAQGYVTQEIVAQPDAGWGGIGVVFMP
jgi:predicted O-methyltransferase YrrM